MKVPYTAFLACLAALCLSLGARAEYVESDVLDGGTVHGKVSIGKHAPQVERYNIAKNFSTCGDGNRDVPLIRANGDALLDVVIYLEDVKSGKRFPAAAKKVFINQKNCEFRPYLSVMANGGEMEAVNSDTVLHNIHIYELTGRGRSTVLNISQPQKGNILKKGIFLNNGNAMKVECDAHDFMHAYIFVASNPYFAVGDVIGEFSISDVPPGNYKINVWHPILGTVRSQVEVTPGGTVNVNFSY